MTESLAAALTVLTWTVVVFLWVFVLACVLLAVQRSKQQEEIKKEYKKAVEEINKHAPNWKKSP